MKKSTSFPRNDDSDDGEQKAGQYEKNELYGILDPEDVDFLASYTDAQRKKVLRKIDLRLIPVLFMLYLISFLDRANIGNAKIEGLEASLHMDGQQYNAALAVFFVPYILGEVPSNIILSRFKRPSTYMGIIVTAWGTVMACTGVVKGFAGLCVVRFLLGLTEAGFFPGAVLLISKWYLPHESQRRIAVFYIASSLAGAVSGILAFAIGGMNGVGGYETWRWIFILEGLASVVVGIGCFFLLVDTPALSRRWLDPEEIRYLQLRQRARQARQTETDTNHFDWRILIELLKDWRIYTVVLVYWSDVVPNYGLKFTMPTIIKKMGFTSAKAQLLTIPPYLAGAVSAYSFAILGDKYRWRMPFIAGPQLALIAAYAILTAKAAYIKENIPLCYFALILAIAGLSPVTPGVQTWNMENLAGEMKRSMGIALVTCLANVGGLIGSFIFIEKEAPKYPTGYGSSLAFATAGFLACFVLEGGLWRINKKNAKFSDEEIRAKYSNEELDRMGDKSPFFKYSL